VSIESVQQMDLEKGGACARRVRPAERKARPLHLDDAGQRQGGIAAHAEARDSGEDAG
jgi:hypothetical protein